ncbi:hypothetical protein FB446DRAFT_771985 [Lentinula raphanica]|nr:hypothetical protein FB446DRAFT_771985 [Lentinula raphanica]
MPLPIMLLFFTAMVTVSGSIVKSGEQAVERARVQENFKKGNVAAIFDSIGIPQKDEDGKRAPVQDFRRLYGTKSCTKQVQQKLIDELFCHSHTAANSHTVTIIEFYQEPVPRIQIFLLILILHCEISNLRLISSYTQAIRLRRTIPVGFQGPRPDQEQEILPPIASFLQLPTRCIDTMGPSELETIRKKPGLGELRRAMARAESTYDDSNEADEFRAGSGFQTKELKRKQEPTGGSMFLKKRHLENVRGPSCGQKIKTSEIHWSFTIPRC